MLLNTEKIVCENLIIYHLKVFVTLGEGVVFGELSILNVPGRLDFLTILN